MCCAVFQGRIYFRARRPGTTALCVRCAGGLGWRKYEKSAWFRMFLNAVCYGYKKGRPLGGACHGGELIAQIGGKLVIVGVGVFRFYVLLRKHRALPCAIEYALSGLAVVNEHTLYTGRCPALLNTPFQG